MTHVDTFIDDFMPCPTDVAYAKWFLFLYRLSAVYKQMWAPQIKQYKLFADYKGKQYRVTGCSRMGDVWLSSDFTREIGYELRVVVDELSNWKPDSN
jgi:hypothetical protein